jgi:two-component system copper resistance phosphate regulon response regulator CusR
MYGETTQLPSTRKEPEPSVRQSLPMRVLVVDDSERVRKTLATGLRSHGMAVDAVADGVDALAMLNGLSFDLVVLDLMMPRVDGMQVLQTLKGWARKPRILVLSARDQVQDRVEALNLGADDYLVKPFAFDELLARLLALGRRNVAAASPELRCGPLTLDTATQLARVDGTVLTLTPKEYALLELLVRRKGHLMGRAVIFEQLYESDSSASDTVIEVLMSTLRAKLSRAGLRDLIETRRGFGYVVA